MNNNKKHIVIIGAGFTGLAAGLELSDLGFRVTLLESDDDVGGLAGGFDSGGAILEKFYHHWFTNDTYVMRLIERLGSSQNILLRPSNTGMYYANKIYRLSTPLDVLRFTPLPLLDRLRLGALVFQVRGIKDWEQLESLTARDWLSSMCGDSVFKLVWEPLLIGKFGSYADQVSAVWFWKKLVLRGGSRSTSGSETLAYYRGGFLNLARQIAGRVTSGGAEVKTSVRALSLRTQGGRVTGVDTSQGLIDADAVIATPALPIIASIVEGHTSEEYLRQLRRVKYLANICLVLELERSLSSTYWLNVNDPTYPFVGVIEHTNLEPRESYGGRHVVYLSKYLETSDPIYGKTKEEVFSYAIPHLARMFPEFKPSWIKNTSLWKADYAQPIVECHYSLLIPQKVTPIEGFFISTMAQIYPEDRGTNYAIRDGIGIARLVKETLS